MAYKDLDKFDLERFKVGEQVVSELSVEGINRKSISTSYFEGHPFPIVVKYTEAAGGESYNFQTAEKYLRMAPRDRYEVLVVHSHVSDPCGSDKYFVNDYAEGAPIAQFFDGSIASSGSVLAKEYAKFKNNSY